MQTACGVVSSGPRGRSVHLRSSLDILTKAVHWTLLPQGDSQPKELQIQAGQDQ